MEGMKQVIQMCNVDHPGKPFVPSDDYRKILSFDGEDKDYNADMPLDKKQLEGPAKKFIESKLKEAKDDETKLVWLLVQARAEVALNTFYLGRKERGEKMEKAKEKGKVYTNRLIPDLENVDLWRLLAMKVQADAAADEITKRAGKNMKIENEKIILRIALFDRKMYGYRQILPKPKSDTRGLGTVRKDVPPAVREAQSGELDVILDMPLKDVEVLRAILERKTQQGPAFYWMDETERLAHETAKTKVFAPVLSCFSPARLASSHFRLVFICRIIRETQVRKVLDRLIAPKLKFDDWQRTIAKPEKISNVKTQTVIAIAKDEKRRQCAYEKGQRVTVLVVLPNPLPRVTLNKGKLAKFDKESKTWGAGSRTEIRYQLSGLYRNTEVRSYVEEQKLKIHRAYYHNSVKKKGRCITHALLSSTYVLIGLKCRAALQTSSVVLTSEDVDDMMRPYLLRIYREDFGLRDLITDIGFQKTTTVKHRYASDKGNNDSREKENTVEVKHDDEDSDDEEEKYGEEEGFNESYYIEENDANNDVGLDLAEH